MYTNGQYQGYPYVNPHVTDVPTVDPVSAARWTNLPRRQISAGPSPQVHGPGQRTPTIGNERRNEASVTRMAQPINSDSPVVYIDLPEASGNEVTEQRVRPTPNHQRQQAPSSSTGQPLPSKPEPAETPVVYIDLPEAGGSDVSQRDEPQYVQETIFYDPFENRRIDVSKRTGTIGSNNSGTSESDVETSGSLRRPPPRPQRPTVLDLSGSSTGTSSSSTIPSISSTIALRTPDSYPLPYAESNQIVHPGSGFPEPPPAYSEYDVRTTTSTPTSVVEQPRPEPPRTQVILPSPVVGLPNPNRKYLRCQHCGMQVHTLVIKEVGLMTHLFALVCLIVCMVPCVLLIYYIDCFKNKNHFCPNCNNKIGYEIPMSSKKVVYVS